jgi:hypothetical protein
MFTSLAPNQSQRVLEPIPDSHRSSSSYFRQLVRDRRGPRRRAGSPVYRILLWLAAWFPEMMERRMVACVKHLFTEPTLTEKAVPETQ